MLGMSHLLGSPLLSGSQKVPTSFLKRAFLFSGDVNLFRRDKKIEKIELCIAVGYSKDLIAEALGHEYGNRVTGIYLEQFDNDIVDKMNQNLINSVVKSV